MKGTVMGSQEFKGGMYHIWEIKRAMSNNGTTLIFLNGILRERNQLELNICVEF